MKAPAQKRNKLNRHLIQSLVLALTLGLAPFFPEPHISGKIRWVMGGASGMQAMDYFDLFLHGFPWVYFIITLAVKTRYLLIQRLNNGS